jgi:hypothetical protein
MQDEQFQKFNNYGGLMYVIGGGILLAGVIAQNRFSIFLGIIDIIIGLAIYRFSKKKGFIGEDDKE